MPRWLPRVLTRIRALSSAGHVGLTDKAAGEAQKIGLSRHDVVQILVAARTQCVVISCHEDQAEAQEEAHRDD